MGIGEGYESQAEPNPIADQWITAMEGLKPILGDDAEETSAGEPAGEPAVGVEANAEIESDTTERELRLRVADTWNATVIADKHHLPVQQRDQYFNSYLQAKRELEEYLEKRGKGGESVPMADSTPEIEQTTAETEDNSQINHGGGNAMNELSGDVIW